MSANISQLIESGDPQDRKQAIKLLLQQGGSDAIGLLGKLYKKETDSEIKELALRAGRHLKKQQEQAASEQVTTEYPVPMSNIKETAALEQKPISQSVYLPAYTQEDDSDEDVITEYPAPMSTFKEIAAPEPKRITEPVEVSARKQQEAKHTLDRALEYSVGGERSRALDLLIKAFKTNPNLRFDQAAMDIAASITRLDYEGALEIIDETPQERKARLKPKQELDLIRVDIRWPRVGLYLLGYFAASVALIFIIAILYNNTERAGFAATRDLLAQGCSTCSTKEYDRLAKMIQNTEAAETFTPGNALVIGLAGAAAVLGLMLVYLGIVHILARLTLRKRAPFHGLIAKAIPPMLGSLVLIYILASCLTIIDLRESFDPHFLSRIARDATLNTGPIGTFLFMVGFGVLLGGTKLLTGALSKYYYVSESYGGMLWIRSFFVFLVVTLVVGTGVVLLLYILV